MLTSNLPPMGWDHPESDPGRGETHPCLCRQRPQAESISFAVFPEEKFHSHFNVCLFIYIRKGLIASRRFHRYLLEPIFQVLPIVSHGPSHF